MRRLQCANASSLGSVGTPILGASFLSRAMHDSNASPDGSTGTLLVAATFHSLAVRDANASLNGYVGAPFPFAIRTTHLMMN